MTKQQFNKILACVNCGISISVAMRRLFGTQSDRPKLLKDQYRKLLIVQFLFYKNREDDYTIDYDLIEYISKKEYVEINKYQVESYPPEKKKEIIDYLDYWN